MVTKKQSKKLNITQNQEIDILRKIVEITNSELDLQWTLNEIVKVVNDMTKADSVFIYLYDEKKENLILMSSKTPHKKELGKINLKAGEGITGWVAKENKPVAISKNAYKDDRFIQFDVLPEDKFEAFLSVPIIYQKKAIGVINIQHKKEHIYAENTVDLISLISKQTGGVIAQARLYEETKMKALQFDSLMKVSTSITSQDYLDEILNLIVVVTAEMLNSKICTIMLLNDKGDELVMKASQALSLDYKKKPNLKVKSSISGDVIKLKKPIVIEDVQKEKKYNFPELAEKEGLTSLISVPMVVRDNPIGIINVYMKTKHKFTQEEIDMLQMVANQAAVAVANTNLMEETIKAKEALEIRKIVERAKGVIMKMNNLDEEAAYRLIHKKSMDSCKSMKEIAESILLMEEFRK